MNIHAGSRVMVKSHDEVFVTKRYSLPVAASVLGLALELQEDVVFTAAVGSETKETAAAKTLIEYLKGPVAVAIIKSKSMNPG